MTVKPVNLTLNATVVEIEGAQTFALHGVYLFHTYTCT